MSRQPQWPVAKAGTADRPAEYASLSVAGRWLATAGRDGEQDDGTVLLWDLEGHRLWCALTHDGPVAATLISSDGAWLASRGKGGRAVRLWDIQAGQLRRVLAHDRPVVQFSFGPDGGWLASHAEGDGAVRLWDVRSGQLRHVLVHDHPVAGWLFGPDGAWLASRAEGDGAVRLWDVRSGQLRHTLALPEPARWLRFSPDGRWLTAGGRTEHGREFDAPLWEVRSGRPAAACLAGGSLLWPVFSRDGRRLATQGSMYEDGIPGPSPAGDGRVWLWDLPADRLIGTLDTRAHCAEYEVTFSPDGRLLATHRSLHGPWRESDDELRVWDVTGATCLFTFHYDSSLGWPQFSPDGRLVAVTDKRAGVLLWDVTTGRLAREIRCVADGDWVADLWFGPGGQLLCVRSGEGVASLWDVASGQLRHQLPQPDVVWCDFSDDGRWLSTLGESGSVLWEL